MQSEKQQIQCSMCDGSGRVTEKVVHVVDVGTKWRRTTAVENVILECSTCNGTGTIIPRWDGEEPRG